MAEGRKKSGLNIPEVPREPEAAGESHKGRATIEEGDLGNAGEVASGKSSRRRRALSAAGDRFSPGASPSSGAAAPGDGEASLIEAAKTTPRRSSIIKDSTRQRQEQKKTVSFSSMPSERKISSAVDCISFMQAGCELKKVRSNTRIYSRFFTLDLDLLALRWEPSKKDPDKAKLDVSSFKEVRVGKNTETFRSCAVVDQICEDCSFSLLYGDNFESLDLVANSADVANIWVTGLRYIALHGEEIEFATLFVHVAITDRRGGGKAHRRGYSVRKGKNTIKYTMLRTIGIKTVDDTFKLAGHPLRQAADIRENVQIAIVSLKEICGLASTANLSQCILTVSSRLLNSENISVVTLSMKNGYPYLEPFATLNDVQRKILSSYDMVIQESKFLIEMADSIHNQIIQCQRSGIQFHEDFHNLGKKEGLKGNKLNRAFESFAWNITVLKGQGDLLKNAKNEALENMKQIHAACISCGLSKTGSESAEVNSHQSLQALQEKENAEENQTLT